MKSFIALYHGSSIGSAELVAVTGNPSIVVRVANQILEDTGPDRAPDVEDPVRVALSEGQKRALEAVRREADAGRDGMSGLP